MEAPIFNQAECNKIKSSQITPQMICAGYERHANNGKKPCRGDSGGPLRCLLPKNGTSEGTLKLVGVVSWGYKCEGYVLNLGPGVYARVTSVRKWIESVAGI